jgi:hypothetical protein
MSSLFNFKPLSQGTVSGAVTGSAADITITSIGANAIRLTNVGTQVVFWKFNTGGASVNTDTPLLPNSTEVFAMPPSTTKISAIAAGAGSTLYITPGVGN